ncbi:MAG: hypothetical protein AB1733_23005 [Thermodesulfobacteriota bacterium]
MPKIITTPVVEFLWDPQKLPDFLPLLRRGILLKARLGATISNVLCEQLGIPREYLDDRVGTVFLDGSAVDNVDKAVVRDGGALALSAAMPGLVGATMRKGGILASMRNSITYREEDPAMSGSEGFFVLRLYNTVAGELGPALLRSGVWTDGKTLRDFLEDAAADLRSGCLECRLDGNACEWTRLLESLPAGQDRVLMRVTT